MRRRAIFVLPALLHAQEAPEDAVEFICPMDRDVHAQAPGKCPRCGMGLVAGLPTPVESPVDLSIEPRRIVPDQPVRIRFRIPGKFQVIHEKLFHLFIVGPGLVYFSHEHPQPQADGAFVLETRLPAPGAYRLVCDFYPEKSTPQLIVKTVIVGGTPPPVLALRPDLTPKTTAGMTIALETEPAEVISAQRTRLLFNLHPVDRFEQFLGAWGHLLIASEDRQDLIHTHPFLADPARGRLQFNVILPRAGIHRVWLQVQQAGEVITAHFDVPAKRLS